MIARHAAVTLGDPEGNGVVRFLEEGAIVPEEGVHQKVLDHLVSVGLIEEFEPEFEPEPEPDAEAFDLGKATVDELKAYAAEHEIDLAGATSKGDIKAAIAAASA